MLKRILRRGLRPVNNWLEADPSRLEAELRASADASSIYPWLNALSVKLYLENRSLMRPAYLWGALHGAHLAKSLGISAISLIEFGVAGGKGLTSLDFIAQRIESIFGLTISVYGFDSGVGLPPPSDIRDCPNLFTAGDYPMAVGELQKRLRKARLILGDVESTLPTFSRDKPDPIAFISFDLDYYSSTRHALRILEADPGLLLPRVHCYFDDISGYTYSDYNGERLAMAEFNQEHISRKISPIYSLQHYVHKRFANDLWTHKCFMAHLFDHQLYSHPDGLVKRARMDLSRANSKTTS